MVILSCCLPSSLHDFHHCIFADAAVTRNPTAATALFSEEQLIGSLDIEQALQDSAVRFAPGLLAKAYRGVLYLDKVNLLPDHLVDVLLDVAASGINIVEHDGISHQHPASFVLIGTMNPDEEDWL